MGNNGYVKFCILNLTLLEEEVILFHINTHGGISSMSWYTYPYLRSYLLYFRVYLCPETSQYSSPGGQVSALSPTLYGPVNRSCVIDAISDPTAPKHAIQAFHLLSTSREAQVNWWCFKSKLQSLSLYQVIHLSLVSTRLLWLHLLVTQMYGMQSWKILLSVVSSNHNSQVILIPIQCVLVL